MNGTLSELAVQVTGPSASSGRAEWRLHTPGPTRILFVASTGGHLAQLVRIADQLDVHPDSAWVTFDSEQSRSLLRGRNTVFVPYVAPRAYGAVLHAFCRTYVALHSVPFDMCVSTGAAVALGVLPWARARAIPCVYVESVSRTEGPSLTGKIVDRLRLAATFSQHGCWAGERTWRLHSSVLGSYVTQPRATGSAGPPAVFVSLGTIAPYRFDRLVDTLLRSGTVDESTVWQLGTTQRSDLPGTVHRLVTATEFDRYCRAADVVVTHAGVGTILRLFEMGLHPIVVPRRREWREHVDDHQLQIADLLYRTGAATVCDADRLTPEVVDAARALCVVPRRRTGERL
jgi:UDP-N-acetylglucosamine transferase subunit ALG13